MNKGKRNESCAVMQVTQKFRKSRNAGVTTDKKGSINIFAELTVIFDDFLF